ncbi:MAG: mechanosensitive ion channel protein MscS [Anaerolineales bacterium]|nr:mechanosensitive ion channel family protein [Anaerolineae bacterium]PWB53356.1 MAG: mechanosensitive ion channel protein MscS [Anaerolineales bacterium]
MQFLTKTFLGNTLAQWALALVIGLFVFGLLQLLAWLLRRRLRKFADQPLPDPSVLIRNLLAHTNGLFFAWLAFFVAQRSLTLSETARVVIDTITITVILLQAGSWAVQVVEYLVARRQIAKDGELNYRKGSINAILLITKITIWTIVILLVLENIPGVHVTTLIASLGVAGIALGLALNKVLGDLFASLTISIDEPFVEGDAISVGEFSGVVEHVGLKSTRVRSGTGEQLIFSNSDLLDSRIRNFKRMEKRMVVFTINITYQTHYKKLQKIPELIREAIETQPQVAFERAHFKAYGPSSLIFEVAYTIQTADFNVYMDLQQKINLEIFHSFQEAGIDFAYPTQTIRLDNKEEK